MTALTSYELDKIAAAEELELAFTKARRHASEAGDPGRPSPTTCSDLGGGAAPPGSAASRTVTKATYTPALAVNGPGRKPCCA